MIAWWWLLLALFTGALAGVFLASLCWARREADEAAAEWYRGE